MNKEIQLTDCEVKEYSRFRALDLEATEELESPRSFAYLQALLKDRGITGTVALIIADSDSWRCGVKTRVTIRYVEGAANER
jgi:hypothetical protein